MGSSKVVLQFQFYKFTVMLPPLIDTLLWINRQIIGSNLVSLYAIMFPDDEFSGRSTLVQMIGRMMLVVVLAPYILTVLCAILVVGRQLY